MSSSLWSLGRNKVFAIAIFSTFMASHVYGQQTDSIRSVFDSTFTIRIEPRLTTVTVRLGISDFDKDEQTFVVYDVTLTDSSSRKTMQTIRDTVEFCMLADFEFIDVNFDSYLDLRLVSYFDAAANTSHHYWLFDKRSMTYVFNRQFSEMLVGETSWQPESKTIVSTGRIGNDLYATDIFSVNSDMLVLQEQFVDDLEQISGQLATVRKHFRLINGVMTQVDMKRVK